MNQVVVMLMAGGAGTRLNILAKERAKPAVPFGGIYRIIDFTLSNAVNSGMDRIGILTQYRPSSLIDHIGDGSYWQTGYGRGDLRILPPYTGGAANDWYRGTADAVYQNLDFIRSSRGDKVLILSGDHVYYMDYRELIGYHEGKGADLTIASLEIPLSEGHRFGLAIVDRDHRIVEFEEKPEKPRSNLASMGIYLFQKDVLIRELVEMIPRKGFDFGHDIVPNMLNRYKMYAYPFRGYWRDVGTLESYQDAHMDFLDPSSGADLFQWNIQTNCEGNRKGDYPSSRIGPEARVTHSMISRGCILEGECDHSVISPGVKIHRGAVVKDSIILHDSEIRQGCVLDHAIIDKSVVVDTDAIVGAGRITSPNKMFPDHLSSGITIVGKGAYIPPGSRIGRNCILFPFVRSQDYPSKAIECGETIQPGA